MKFKLQIEIEMNYKLKMDICRYELWEIQSGHQCMISAVSPPANKIVWLSDKSMTDTHKQKDTNKTKI